MRCSYRASIQPVMIPDPPNIQLSINRNLHGNKDTIFPIVSRDINMNIYIYTFICESVYTPLLYNYGLLASQASARW